MVQSSVAAGPVEFGFRAWPAQAGQLTRVSAEVRGWLASLGDLTAAAVDGIVLAVSAAADNVVEHAYRGVDCPGGTIDVTFWTEPGAVCIEVVDHGRWRPPAARPSGELGTGMVLMRRLVEAVVIGYGPLGTRVLLRHPRPGDALPLAAEGDRSTAMVGAYPDEV